MATRSHLLCQHLKNKYGKRLRLTKRREITDNNLRLSERRVCWTNKDRKIAKDVRQGIWSKPMNYSRILRVIGQTLEPLRPETYEVVSYGNCYLVRCRVKEDRQGKKQEEKKVRGLAAFLRLWREPGNRQVGGKPNEGTSMNVEFLYSVEELNRQDEERKQPRHDPNAMPDPYSFSSTLRAVGEFLDRKPDAKLLFASNRGQELVILYETKDGVRNLEEYPVSTLYEFWVKEYVKRKK